MSKHERLTLIAAILGSGIVFLDGSVVNIALPAITGGLHTDYSGLQWVVNGYLLTLSAMILFGGSLGDLFGQKRVFEVGLIGFGLASLLCGLSPDITVLTVARLVQGVFGALLVPSSLAVINTTFQPEKRAQAIGRWTAYAGVFTALGPLAGGLLLELSWRWIFLINIPLAVACFYFIHQGVTDTKKSGPAPRLDIAGALLAVIGLGAATFGLIDGPAHGWTVMSVTALVGGVAALAGFVLYERYSAAPMLPLSLFKSRNFTGANLATLGMYAALSGALLSVVLYLQTAVGYSPLAAGLAFLPVTAIMLFLSGRMGALSSKYGPRAFMTAGPVLAAAGFLLMLAISPTHANYALYILPSALVFGLGLAITVAPLTATVMSSVTEERSGIASAVNNAVSRLAGLLVVAFLGVVVASQTTHSLNISRIKLSPQSVNVVHQAIAGGLKPVLLAPLPRNQKTAVVAAVQTAERGTFVYAMILNALLAFAAGLVAFAVIRNPRKLP